MAYLILNILFNTFKFNINMQQIIMNTISYDVFKIVTTKHYLQNESPLGLLLFVLGPYILVFHKFYDRDPPWQQRIK